MNSGMNAANEVEEPSLKFTYPNLKGGGRSCFFFAAGSLKPEPSSEYSTGLTQGLERTTDALGVLLN